MQNRGTHKVSSNAKALLSRQFVAKSRNMYQAEVNDTDGSLIASPKKGKFTAGYTTDLAIHHAKSERKHLTGREIGAKSQTNQTKPSMVPYTLDKSENRQKTTMERKNSLNETVAGTAQSFSQT